MNPIDAYTSAPSVKPGDSLDFHVSCEQGSFTIEVLRRGLNDVVVFRDHGNAPPLEAPANAYEAGCGWPVAFTLNIGQDWQTGYYIARLTAMFGFNTEVPFVVRPAAPGETSTILFSMTFSTLQAYNFWGGRSLYGHMEGTTFQWADPRAYRVSFDRPYITKDITEFWELPFIQWLEKNGFAAEYCTSVDLHADSSLLQNYRLFLSVGHDEYWSKEMRDQVEQFVANGGNAAFFSGNVCWWQVRFENANRTMVCYKDAMSVINPPRHLDELQEVEPDRVTTNWAFPPVNRPENAMTGVGSTNGAWWSDLGRPLVGYQIRAADHWVFENTGLQNGDELGRGDSPDDNVVGYESDGLVMKGPIGLTDVLIADSATGSAAVYVSDGSGQFTDGNGQPLPRNTYDNFFAGEVQVIAGDFGRGCYTDLFVYDRSTGSAELRRFDRNGDFSIVKQFSGLSTAWTHLASGRLSGRGLSDVVAYDSDAGAIEISSFDTGANFTPYSRTAGLGSSWTHFATGRFGPRYWYHDILLFDRTAGRLQIHTIDPLGNLSLFSESTGLGTNWTHLVVVKLLKTSATTDLLLYDQDNGIGEFWRCDGQPSLTLIHRHTDWSTGWTHIVSGRFGGGFDQPGLLFYNGTQGVSAVYSVFTDGQMAVLNPDASLPSALTQILPGHFESQVQPEVDGSDGTPDNFVILATADLTDWGKPGWAVMGTYNRGGEVFTAASTNWARGLSLDAQPNPVNTITENVIRKFIT